MGNVNFSMGAPLGDECWLYETAFRAYQLAYGQLEMEDIERTADQLLKGDLPQLFGYLSKLQAECKSLKKYRTHLEKQIEYKLHEIEELKKKNSGYIGDAELMAVTRAGCLLPPEAKKEYKDKAAMIASQANDQAELLSLEKRINQVRNS